MKTGAHLLTGLSLCILFIAGCAAPKYNLPAPASKTESMPALLDYYPEEFRISQHIIMKIGGKEYDFIGYLAKSRSGDIRAVAFGEMGGKIFDFMEKNGTREVLVRPDGMPLNPLLDGVMGDISHLYKADMEGAYPAERQDGHTGLVVRKNGDRIAEYIYAKDDSICSSSIEAIGGRVVRRAEYADYRVFPGWDRPLPSRTTLSNYRWHYDLRIELLKVDAAPIDEQILFTK